MSSDLHPSEPWRRVLHDQTRPGTTPDAQDTTTDEMVFFGVALLERNLEKVQGRRPQDATPATFGGVRCRHGKSTRATSPTREKNARSSASPTASLSTPPTWTLISGVSEALDLGRQRKVMAHISHGTVGTPVTQTPRTRPSTDFPPERHSANPVMACRHAAAAPTAPLAPQASRAPHTCRGGRTRGRNTSAHSVSEHRRPCASCRRRTWRAPCGAGPTRRVHRSCAAPPSRWSPRARRRARRAWWRAWPRAS